MWRPSASIEALQYRAKAYQFIRQYFEELNVLEVETPILSKFATTDPSIESFVCTSNNEPNKVDSKRYLQTSPEFAMKRLLAAGFGSIFQLCKVFRQEELGRWHNPEFTLLEWYRPSMDYHELMDETITLIQSLLANHHYPSEPLKAEIVSNEADTPKANKQELMPVRKLSYADLFKYYIGINPHLIKLEELTQLISEHQIELNSGAESLDKDSCLQLLLTHVIEPAMPQKSILVVYDYPESQASLAQIKSCGDYKIAQRFECFFNGVELANGFQELTSASEQKQRFEMDLEQRTKQKLGTYPYDRTLIAALDDTKEHGGLPDCAGVAVGVDRVLAFAFEISDCQVEKKDKNSLSTVLAFNFERA